MTSISALTADPTGQLLKTGLDRAELTHRTIAHNIANANSPGFAPLKTRFDAVLGDAMSSATGPNATGQTAPQVVTDGESLPGPGGIANIDLQMARMNQNFIWYQQLLRGMGQRIGWIDIAMNDGRR